MDSFLQKNDDVVTGTLRGFDRLLFRGSLRAISFVEGLFGYLCSVGVLLTQFSEHSQQVTAQLRDSLRSFGKSQDRPRIYLPSSRTRKGDLAREIAERDGITTGLVCILECVEPCMSFQVEGNRRTKKLELKPRLRKCAHAYVYYLHPRLGFLHVRFQTWFPFTTWVCINGREWLARQMDGVGMAYSRRDNCFPWIEDVDAAQALMDQQLTVNWENLLNAIVGVAHPQHAEFIAPFRGSCYWTADQSEWATDVMFESTRSLAARYPTYLRHGISTFGSPDVLRFLGRPIPESGRLHHNLRAEVVSDVKSRPEGVRIKHRVNGNSVKAYDKHGSILRIETTINDPNDFKVYRPRQGEDSDFAWRKMRKGTADMYRRAQVSDACNVRYLDALASTKATTPLSAITEWLCRPAKLNGRRVRAFRPHSPEDAALLAAIAAASSTSMAFVIATFAPCSTPNPAPPRRSSADVRVA